jgi:hypothetical protein
MVRFGNLTFRAPILGVLATLVLAACNPGAGADPTLTIVSPADGDELAMTFEIQVESNVPLGAPETGNHHVHFYFDTDISSPDYQIVYGSSATVEPDLTPGQHTIIVSLRNADHSDAGPSQEITVNVTGGDGATESEPAPSDPGADDY